MKKAVLVIFLLAAMAVGIWANRADVQKVSASDDTVFLPVAMYHSITGEGDSPSAYVIPPSAFENDLKYLSERGYTAVTITDLANYVLHGGKLPEKPVMLTFDDGFYNNYCNAYPLLKKYHMRAVLSPVGALTEQFSQTSDTEEHEVWSYCTGTELKEMADSGVIEIQNHSYDLHTLEPRRGCLRKSGEDKTAYERMFHHDTQQAQNLFTSLGIDAPICYTYPYGARNDETEKLVEENGFIASLSCEEGVSGIVRDPACLKHIKRYNRDGRSASEQFWGELLAKAEEGGS